MLLNRKRQGGFLDIFKPDTPLYEEPLFKKERRKKLKLIHWNS